MGRMPRIAYFWPGLPQLWTNGSWFGLVVAVVFTVFLNFLLVASVVWTEWIDPELLLFLWVAVLSTSLVAAWLSLRGNSSQSLATSQGQATDIYTVEVDDDRFRDVQQKYLAGNWYEAEALLNQILKKNVRDAEAGLLLATLLRHTGRYEEAQAALDRLDPMETADRWQQEVARERKLIARDLAEAEEESSDENEDNRAERFPEAA